MWLASSFLSSVVMFFAYSNVLFSLQTLRVAMYLKAVDGKLSSSPVSLVFEPAFPVSREKNMLKKQFTRGSKPDYD